MLSLPREHATEQCLKDLPDIFAKELVKLPKRKVILVTGDSWAAGEWRLDIENFDELFEWRSRHSTGWYLQKLTGYHVLNMPNPGWDDTESIITLTNLAHLVDYVVFFKTCGLRAIQHENHPGRPGKMGFDLKNFTVKNLVTQGLAVNDLMYELLKPYESKLILLGGLNKISRKGLELKTIHTLPSIIEFFDPHAKDVEVFGWEDMWSFYKEEVKGDKEYQESLLFMMDVFAQKKKYMRSRPDLYWPDGKHPNATAHKKLAEYIAGKI